MPEKLTPEQFQQEVRELAAVAGREVMWTAAEGVICGFLTSALEHPNEWIEKAGRVDRTIAEVIAESLAQSLQIYFEGGAQTNYHDLAEEVVLDLESDGLIDSGHREAIAAILAERVKGWTNLGIRGQRTRPDGEELERRLKDTSRLRFMVQGTAAE